MEKFDDNQDLLGAALAVAMTINGDERDEITETIAMEYAQRDDIQKAAEVVETIQDPYLHDKGLGALAVRAVEVGDQEFSDQLLNTVEDPSLLTIALEQMALSYARKGDFDTALRICDELEDNAQALSAIAVTYAANGFPEQAAESARGIEAPLPRTLTFVEIASAAQTQNIQEAADELLAEASESAAEIEFPEDQVDARVTIASVYEKLGKTELAYEQLMEAISICNDIESGSGVITATSVRDHQLSIIAWALANLKFFDKADEVLETIEDPFRFALGSGQVALAYHKDQRQTQANELLAQAVEITEEADVVSEQAVAMQQEVFANLALMYATNGQIEKSLEVIEHVHRVGLKNDYLAEIGRVAVRIGSDPTVVSESFADEVSKASFWLAVSDEYDKSGRDEEADEALKRSIKCAEQSGDRPYEQALSFGEIATRSAAGNRLEQATLFFQRALSTIPGIASSTRRSLVLLDLARKYRQLSRDLNDSESALLREILTGLDL